MKEKLRFLERFIVFLHLKMQFLWGSKITRKKWLKNMNLYSANSRRMEHQYLGGHIHQALSLIELA